MNKININWNICRICLGEDENVGDFNNIFDNDRDNIEISYKINQCGGVHIKKDVNLPDLICHKCLAFLNVSYKFRLICQESDGKLLDFLKKSNIPEEKVILEPIIDEQVHNGPMPTAAPASSTSEEFLDAVIEAVDEEACNEINNGSEYIVNEVEIVDGYNVDLKETINDDTNTEVIIAEEIEMDFETFAENNDNGDDVDEEIYIESLNSKKTITLLPLKMKPKVRLIHMCEVCGNHYDKRSALENHMKWHAQNKSSVCEICKKGFVTEFQLGRHMRTHTGERPYSCQFCQRKFSDISTKTKHERIHTNERPYKCDICPKAFNYSDVLRTHKMTHSGEKPFGCMICEKRFTQFHHLKAHLKTLSHKSNSSAYKPEINV